MTIAKLKNKLLQIDHKSYKAYKEIQGTYKGDWFKLHIDYVQGDPFASPSRISIEILKETTTLKKEYDNTFLKSIALSDFLTREIAKNIKTQKLNTYGTGKSGLIYIDAPGEEILPRTSIKLTPKEITIRLSVGLPARGRTILGKDASKILCEIIPSIIKKSIFNFNEKELLKHLNLIAKQKTIRNYLKENNYISFIANNSILPRESGISNKPSKEKNVVPFKSPKSLEIEIPLSDNESIKGMGIKKGITLIVGGGYHGKSTLLKAIERGVYNHILGDGREYVLTDASAFKIRAEDGRKITGVNISPFINNLPFGMNTAKFSSSDASGSTSEAANIIEALELDSKVLLIDEDTSATNFMIRDARMQKLVAKDKEPITPFVDKVTSLYQEHDVSTILVIGGSGDYFDVSDTVIMMDEYLPKDVTEDAKEISKSINNYRKTNSEKFGDITPRIILKNSFDSSKGRKEKVDSKGLSTIIYGINTIDLSLVEQLVDTSQTRAIALMINYLAKKIVDNKLTLKEIVDKLYNEIATKGLDIISPYYGKHPGDLALPRKLELVSAINRLRTLKV